MEIYNNNTLSEGWTQESAGKLCEYFYKLQPDLFFVAEREKKIVGFTFSYVKPWADGNQLFVEEIAVDKDHRKGGTAFKLARELMKVAIEKYKVTKVNGTTYQDESGMPFKLYKKMGFKKSEDLFLVDCESEKVKNWVNAF